MLSASYYTVKDFNDLMFQGFEYKLPDDIIDNLKKLEKLLDIPSGSDSSNSSNNFGNKSSTSGFKDKHIVKKFDNRNPRKDSRDINSQDWNVSRNFKPTKMEEKTGIEKQINDIRISINKISNKNYESQKNNIITMIVNFLSEESSQDNHFKIVKAIFDIASTNKFYSEIYADLYTELYNNFEIFRGNILNDFIQNYKENIQNINYVDPNVDYNSYCAYTKSNDIRKATSTFIINLMKKSVLTNSSVLDILDYLQLLLLKYIDEPNRSNEIEEITENIFIICSIGYQLLSSENSSNWQNIVNTIYTVSKMNSKEHISLTNRAIFKHMDILDSFKN